MPESTTRNNGITWTEKTGPVAVCAIGHWSKACNVDVRLAGTHDENMLAFRQAYIRCFAALCRKNKALAQMMNDQYCDGNGDEGGGWVAVEYVNDELKPAERKLMYEAAIAALGYVIGVSKEAIDIAEAAKKIRVKGPDFKKDGQFDTMRSCLGSRNEGSA